MEPTKRAQIKPDYLNVRDSFTTCSPRLSMNGPRCDLQPNILDTVLFRILLLWNRRASKPKLGKHHEHPLRPEPDRLCQGGRLCDEPVMAAKVAGTQRADVVDIQRGESNLSPIEDFSPISPSARPRPNHIPIWNHQSSRYCQHRVD